MKNFKLFSRLIFLAVLITLISCTPEPAATPADLDRLNGEGGNTGSTPLNFVGSYVLTNFDTSVKKM